MVIAKNAKLRIKVSPNERERYKLRISGEVENVESNFVPNFAFCASYIDI